MARVLNSGLLRRRRRSGGGVLIIVNDPFTRADSAVTLGSAPTGQAWSAVGGTWGISSNQAYNPTQAANGMAVVDAGVSNCSVQATFAAATGSDTPAIAFRVTDINNFWVAQSKGNGTTLDIWKCVAGVFTQAATVAYTWADGDVVKVVLSGASIAVFINGAQKTTASDAFNQTATKHGIGGNGGPFPRWDNFLVTVP